MVSTVKELAEKTNTSQKAIRTYLHITSFKTELTRMQVDSYLQHIKYEEPKMKEPLNLGDSSLPSMTRVATKIPVEVVINGNAFRSKVINGQNITEVDYTYLPSFLQIVEEAYGDIIVE